jgi:hypothetical protein
MESHSPDPEVSHTGRDFALLATVLALARVSALQLQWAPMALKEWKLKQQSQRRLQKTMNLQSAVSKKAGLQVTTFLKLPLSGAY